MTVKIPASFTTYIPVLGKVHRIDKRVVASWMVRNGYNCPLTYLGSGASRRVFALNDDYVLKYDPWDGGDNIDERDKYISVQMSNPELAELLCPIRAFGSDGSWCVMDRVKPARATGGSDEQLYRRLAAFRNRLKTDLGLEDTHLGNIGKTKDGRWVAIDYSF